jgi:hypothetical protein
MDDVEEADPDSDTTTEETGPLDGMGVPYGDVACADAENHGEYVSGVARDSRVDDADGNRGSIVSEAAQTDCGKTDDDDESDDDESDSEDIEDDTSDDDDDRDDKSDDDDDDRGNNGNGNGNNGNGNGNGKKDK